jgi:hypothetical protein
MSVDSVSKNAAAQRGGSPIDPVRDGVEAAGRSDANGCGEEIVGRGIAAEDLA